MKTPRVTARAHTNIALVKYWGKRDENLIIPMNSSLSLTLDEFYTETTVQFDSQRQTDQLILDGVAQPTTRVTPFLNVIRNRADLVAGATVISTNHVPTAAGLASSASAYAALAAAASRAAGLTLNRQALSRLARRGSGSATRSIFGGFTEWQAGIDDTTSYAVPLDEHPTWPIRMITVVVSRAEKKIGSRVGMQTVVNTSPFYQEWVKKAQADLAAIKPAIAAHNIQQTGMIAESNAMAMHALNLTATPHFTYFTAGSLTAMRCVEELRATGIPCYYTMDAGPNVKVLCEEQHVPSVLTKLQHCFNANDLLVAHPGPGVQIISED
ncbi:MULTISPECIES: diphosphomevalonate decarboxylase [unclassified Ligilactobacillus]|uniref:diphosphomevalonate decarboxylase n=1 Tax=unclassified Ligilactobacillus TaxID=2767920 RepID=UPI0038540CE4